MKLKNKGNGNILSIVFYVVAGLMFLGFLLSFYNVTTYIIELLDAGQVSLSAQWLDIILYYINNTFVYLGLGTLIFGMGYMNKEKKDSVQEVLEENTENQE